MNLIKRIYYTVVLFTLGLTSLHAQDAQTVLDSAKAAYDRQEYELAAGLYYKLAKEGRPEGMLEIAYMLRDGTGIEKNENQALLYFEEAAELGFTYSFQPLADLYKKQGQVEEAIMFYKMAAKEYPENNKTIAILYFEEENYEEALPYIKKIVKADDADGMFMLGVMYYEGWGMDPSEKMAYKWLKKSADLGHPGAINFINDVAAEHAQNETTEEDYDTEFDINEADD